MAKIVKLKNDTYIANDIYSDREMIVGKWKDNKPIYRRIYVLPTIGYNTFVSIDLGLTNIDNIIYVAGNIQRNIPGTYTPSENWYSIDNPYVEWYVIKKTGTFRISSINQYVTFSSGGYIIIEYTKTTD